MSCSSSCSSYSSSSSSSSIDSFVVDTGGGSMVPPSPFLRSRRSYDENLTSVYIKDDAYAWLPAKILETRHDKVKVSIKLPFNWHTSTVLSQDSTIEELEDYSTTTSSSSSPPLVLRTVSLLDYDKGELPLQNLDKQTHTCIHAKRDMADLHFLHEASILYNLKERHATLQPYTRVGDIVVAMNPFTWIENLYSPQTRRVYAKNLIWEAKQDQEDSDDDKSNVSGEEQEEGEYTSKFGSVYDKLGFDPHVYEISSLAYRGLALTNTHQTILVSGESGAGKTETVKILMESLATVETTRPQTIDNSSFSFHTASTISGGETVTRVLESNPVFEAFGNAKTIRNDNSSRFGKFTQLQFDVESIESAQRQGRNVPFCMLAGSTCTTYLLEKSRVVSHSTGERTYHIFYQLLAAPDEFKRNVWEELEGCTNESFKYVGYTETNAVDGMPDTEQWSRTLEALEVFTLHGKSLRTLMRALCVVLQLGNLTFDHDPATDHEEGGTVITSVEELDKLSKLIGIPADEIEAAMTLRFIKTGYDEVNVQLRPSVAKDSCDALAKEIYSRVFDFLVGKINDYTTAEKHYAESREFGLISLLDIFGFERFQVNRFEQLCINYANEQLQQKYVLDNFRQVQEEYIAEGIQIYDFKVVDNAQVLDLLEGQIGLIISLNEECIRPNGNDESYVYKIKMVHKTHERLIDKKLHDKTEFGVKHFAGPVTYDATKFVERNTDKLPEDLFYCAAKSTNDLIRQEFEGVIKSHQENQASLVVYKKRTNKTVLQKFRTQLKDLMQMMENTTTRYIRCIKPNGTMTPKLTDHNITMQQLECAGLVTAIAISRESYPNRLGYEATNHRFGVLLTKDDHRNIRGMNRKDKANYILSTLLVSMAETHKDGTMTMPFACGKTRIFFRAGALEVLETKRLDYYTRRVVRVQCWIRKLQGQAKYATFRESLIRAQAIARGRIEWKHFQRQKQMTIALQCWTRQMFATAKTQDMRRNHAATVIQAMWRGMKTTKMLDYIEAAMIIQHVVRSRRNKSVFHEKLGSVAEEARMNSELMRLKQRVAEEATRRACRPETRVNGRPADRKLMVDVENMFEYLHEETVALRAENCDLQDEARESEMGKRELLSVVESAESAAAASRLRVAQLTKINQSLVNDTLSQKREMAKLRKEQRSHTVNNEEQVAAVWAEHDRIMAEQGVEVQELKKSMKRERRAFKQEKKSLKAEIAKLDEEHVAEVLYLKDELRRTQDSHRDYLAKLMDVLETTHAARESETARISAELQAVKEEKDGQILKLQRELDTMRGLNKGKVSGIQSDLKSKEGDIDSMREELRSNSEARTQRSQRFQEVAAKLEATVVPDGSPRSGHEKKRAEKVKKMIGLLGNLYALEESSQAKVNEDLVKELDEYMVASEPDRAVEELRTGLKFLAAENRKLKRAVQDQAVCQRCERRDQKRREQQRSGEQERRRSNHIRDGSDREMGRR